MTTPRVTVIMRTKNTDWVIAQALSALFSQTYTDFELLVVDSGSTDRTLEIVRRFPCRLLQIDPGDYVPGTVLNQAISGIESEIVVFQNADVVPLSPHTLEHLVRAFDDPDVQAAFGRQIPRPEAETWVRRDYATSFPEKGPAPEWITLSLPLAAMRRSIWAQRPFYTDAWGSEDTEWGHWARQNGQRIAYVPDAIVMHSHNYTLRQIYGRRFIEGEADAFIYRGHQGPVGMVRRMLTTALREMGAYLRAHDYRGLPGILPRAIVAQWAYYKGRKHGEKRLLTHDSNVQTGQQIVLSRHESNRQEAL